MSCHPEQSRDNAQLKAMNVVMKVPEKLTPRGKGKELRVPLSLVEKTWHWVPYNPTYIRNMEWILAVQSSPNQ